MSLLQLIEEDHIYHALCEGNQCADILAKGAYASNSFVLYLYPPSCIMYQLLANARGVTYPRFCIA